MVLKKWYGQHLLLSKGVISKIAQEAYFTPEDIVVEIGPGTGNLTEEILKYPIKQLHLIEIDKDMVEVLNKNIKDDRVFIYNQDATKFNLCSIGKQIKVVGNLPYNVASLIIENVIFHKECVIVALFMVQKEVAQKIQKGPSWLSTFVRTFYSVDYIMSVPAKFFVPPPKVQSALIKLSRLTQAPNFDLKAYKSFLTRIYANKRKALKNKVDIEILKRLNIDPMQRVDQLSLDQVKDLFLEHGKTFKAEV